MEPVATKEEPPGWELCKEARGNAPGGEIETTCEPSQGGRACAIGVQTMKIFNLLIIAMKTLPLLIWLFISQRVHSEPATPNLTQNTDQIPSVTNDTNSSSKTATPASLVEWDISSPTEYDALFDDLKIRFDQSISTWFEEYHHDSPVIKIALTWNGEGGAYPTFLFSCKAREFLYKNQKDSYFKSKGLIPLYREAGILHQFYIDITKNTIAFKGKVDGNRIRNWERSLGEGFIFYHGNKFKSLFRFYSCPERRNYVLPAPPCFRDTAAFGNAEDMLATVTEIKTSSFDKTLNDMFMFGIPDNFREGGNGFVNICE